MEMDTKQNTVVHFRTGSEENGSIYPPPTGNGYHRSDDDVSSDEDDVFPDDGLTDHTSKPLMHPRQRGQRQPKVKVHRANTRCNRVIWPSIYIFIFLSSMAAIVCLIIYIVNTYTNRLLLQQVVHHPRDNRTVVGCTDVAVEDVWTLGLPKLLTESAFRLVDVDGDHTLDVIFGFATGGDKLKEEPLVCEIYFNGTHPCAGGIMAVDGLTGKEIWRLYTSHEIFALNCNADMDKDGVLDCLGGGRAGIFVAVSGGTGKQLWRFNDTAMNEIMNTYTPQYVDDLNDDGVPDILNIHGGDPLGEPGSETRLEGRIIFLSGKDGKVLKWLTVPDHRESYYSPVIYSRRDGTRIVLFGTGGETHAGSLYYITLDDLWKGQIDKARVLYSDNVKGIMTPPVLLDLTQDGIADIVFVTFNSSICAYNGDTFEKIWNFTFPSSETYATPSPGYYNDDDVPDFLVRWQHGPGFPMYYHSITTVIDGKTGKPLIEPYPKDTIGAQTSPLTLSAEGQGHDLFLYWISDCKGHEGEGGEYAFVEGTNIHEQTRSDFCRLRFKSTGYSRMLALGSKLPLPGAVVYDSTNRKELENSAWVNTSAEAWRWLQAHPDNMQEYEEMQAWLEQRNKHTEQVPDYPTYDASPPDLTDYSSLLESALHPNVGRKTGEQSQIHTNVGRKTGRPASSYSSGYNLNNGYSLNNQNGYGYPDGYDIHQNVGRKSGSSYRRPVYDPNDQYNNQRVNVGQRQRQGGVFSDYLRDQEGQSYPTYNQINDYMQHFLGPQGAQAGRVQRERGPGGDSVGNLDMENKGSTFRESQTNGKDAGQTLSRSHRTKRSDRNVGELNTENERKIRSEREGIKEMRFEDALRMRRDRHKRHVGPHDAEGLQRLISTGTLAPPTMPKDHPMYPRSMDVIFATYWFYPAKTKAILPEDWKCIEERMQEETIRFDPDSEFYGMDHDAFQHAVTDWCLEQSGHQLPEEGTYESQVTSNVYNLHMGQMTLYRLRLKCSCGNEGELRRNNKRCAEFLPFEDQQWPAYMGPRGTSHWLPRKQDER